MSFSLKVRLNAKPLSLVVQESEAGWAEDVRRQFQDLLKHVLVFNTSARLPNGVEIPVALNDVFDLQVAADPATAPQKWNLVLALNLDGARKVAYRYNRALADEAKKSKKEPGQRLSRSVRAAAQILDRLTEEPTGNPKFDIARNLILDKTIEGFTAGMASQVRHRLGRTLDEFVVRHQGTLRDGVV